MKLILAALFFITAGLYASVGFGGGSTYTALLILMGTPHFIVPIVSLSCNILVVTGNSFRYAKQKLIVWPKLWPLLMTSVPAAWMGGRLHISETVFIGLLWVALAVAGLRLLFFKALPECRNAEPSHKVWLLGVIGAAIGFYAGLVGIGGGIFLAPILYAMRWGSSRQIAAACSLFILLNSLSGIAAHISKLAGMDSLTDALAYWPVIPSVLIGGYIGNHLGVFKISELWLKRLTGVLILTVAIRLAWRWLMLVS